ncbi:MAG: magnesium transporter [Pseudomonadota bacterium]|jgi:magnesium transporter
MIAVETVSALIEQRELHALRDTLIDSAPVEIAELFQHLSDEERVLIFRILPRDVAADIFAELDVDLQRTILNGLGDKQTARLLYEMAADDRTALLEEIPAEAARQLLALLPKDDRDVALTLLGYPEGSVGRLMSPDYLTIHEDWKVREVLDHIRAHGQESDSLDTLYVVDAKGVLVDEVAVKNLLLASLDDEVASLMNYKFEALSVQSDQEQAVELFKKYDRPTLPVVDAHGVLLGIVTVDDILDVQEEEVTEDIQKLGGSEALEDAYIKTPVATLIRKRATWLIVLFVGEMLTTTAMANFEGEIQRAVVLALFVPLIISSGGNSGSQASTLVIRALAVGEIRTRDWFTIMRRELITGWALGTILGAVGFLRIVVGAQFSDMYGPHWFLLAVTVLFSLMGVVTLGSLAGSMLPLALKRLKLDPATSSAPFVATLVDVVGLILYFTIAALLLSGTML